MLLAIFSTDMFNRLFYEFVNKFKNLQLCFKDDLTSKDRANPQLSNLVLE